MKNCYLAYKTDEEREKALAWQPIFFYISQEPETDEEQGKATLSAPLMYYAYMS